MSNPITVNVTSVTKDSPGAGQVTIVGTYDQATAYAQPAQRVTVGNFPNAKFSRAFQLTEAALFSIRNGATNIVALAAAGFAKIVVALDPTQTYLPIFTTSPATASCAFASGHLTSDNTNVANNDTVVIGSKTYTFKTALTPTEGEVLIGGSADASLLNLINAINHTGTPNTDYKCAAAHTQVWAEAAVATHVLTIHALAIGTAPNSYATTETSAHLSWGAVTLTGGTVAAAFTVVADSELAVTYQWQYSADGSSWTNCSGTPVNGTTYSNYTTAALTCTPAATAPGPSNPGTGQSGYWHRCVATNSLGSTNSARGQLAIS